MLMYPSKDDLLKNVNSDYSLVILAAKRSHEIRAHQWAERNNQESQGVKPMLDSYQSVSPIGMALEEIASGDVVVAPQAEESIVDEVKED